MFNFYIQLYNIIFIVLCYVIPFHPALELSLNHSKQLTSLRLFRLLQDKSCDWDKIGRELGIEQNFRTTLTRNLALTDEARLEYILEKWLESSYPSPTWLDFMKILTDYLKFGDVAQRTQAFVSTIPC